MWFCAVELSFTYVVSHGQQNTNGNGLSGSLCQLAIDLWLSVH